MSDKINIQEILLKHKIGYRTGSQTKSAIKEIVESVIDKCAEKSILSIVEINRKGFPIEKTRYTNNEYQGYEGENDDPILVNIDKDSILQVKQQINYE